MLSKRVCLCIGFCLVAVATGTTFAEGITVAPPPVACRPPGAPTAFPHDSREAYESALSFARAFVPQFYVYKEFGDNRPRFLSATAFALHSEIVLPQGAVLPAVPNLEGLEGNPDQIRQLFALMELTGGTHEHSHEGRNKQNVGDAKEREAIQKQFKLDVDVRAVEAITGVRPVVYARMWPEPVEGDLERWRIQYNILLSNNDRGEEDAAWRFLGKDPLNHEGDWLYIELVIKPHETGWQLVRYVMNNHSRLIMVDLTDDRLNQDQLADFVVVRDNAIHPKIWLEPGSHEPFPFFGKHGLDQSPVGVWYTHEPDSLDRDYFLDHRAPDPPIDPTTIDLRLIDLQRANLAITPDNWIVGRDFIDAEKLFDIEFVTRFDGAYGHGPRDADNPQGPYYMGRGYTRLENAELWRDASLFEVNSDFGAFLEFMILAGAALQDYFDWVGDSPWKALTWFVVGPVLMAFFVLMFLLGGIQFVLNFALSAGGGGHEGPDKEKAPGTPIRVVEKHNEDFPPLVHGGGNGEANVKFRIVDSIWGWQLQVIPNGEPAKIFDLRREQEIPTITIRDGRPFPEMTIGKAKLVLTKPNAGAFLTARGANGVLIQASVPSGANTAEDHYFWVSGGSISHAGWPKAAAAEPNLFVSGYKDTIITTVINGELCSETWDGRDFAVAMKAVRATGATVTVESITNSPTARSAVLRLGQAANTVTLVDRKHGKIDVQSQ